MVILSPDRPPPKCRSRRYVEILALSGNPPLTVWQWKWKISRLCTCVHLKKLNETLNKPENWPRKLVWPTHIWAK